MTNFHKVTIEQAEKDPYGRNCPINVEFPCMSMGSHTEWETASGKVYAKCRKCKKAFILRERSTPRL